MGLTDIAKADIKQITGNATEWGVELVFTAPTAETATITGLHTKHHLGMNEEGRAVNSKTASVSFSEEYLTDVDYPVRDLNGEVNLKNHLVSVKDSTGVVKNYKVHEWFPDEKVGLIVCILADYESE